MGAFVMIGASDRLTSVAGVTRMQTRKKNAIFSELCYTTMHEQLMHRYTVHVRTSLFHTETADPPTVTTQCAFTATARQVPKGRAKVSLKNEYIVKSNGWTIP